MSSMNVADVDIVAATPDELKAKLKQALEEAIAHHENNKDYYISFKLLNHESIIAINFSQFIPQFRHKNILDRPALQSVKDTIAEVMREKYGAIADFSQYFHDVFKEQLHQKVQDTLANTHTPLPDDPRKASLEALRHHGLFHVPDKSVASKEPQMIAKPPKPKTGG